MNKNTHNPLFDPLIMHSNDVIYSKYNILKRLNMRKIVIYYVLPISLTLFVLFALKDRYMQKKRNDINMEMYND